MTIELTTRKYTADEFLALPDDGKRYELVDGELVEMSQPGDEHGTIIDLLYPQLSQFVRQNKLGKTYVTTGFRLGLSFVRAPDIAFVQTERVQPVIKGAVPVPPDLAVEVISPNDDWTKIEEKIREYQLAGVKLVWVISPVSQAVFVYRPERRLIPQGFGSDETLDGEKVVPGFKFAISQLFDYPTAPDSSTNEA